jgi:hypothetical protein
MVTMRRDMRLGRVRRGRQSHNASPHRSQAIAGYGVTFGTEPSRAAFAIQVRREGASIRLGASLSRPWSNVDGRAAARSGSRASCLSPTQGHDRSAVPVKHSFAYNSRRLETAQRRFELTVAVVRRCCEFPDALPALTSSLTREQRCRSAHKLYNNTAGHCRSSGCVCFQGWAKPPSEHIPLGGFVLSNNRF